MYTVIDRVQIYILGLGLMEAWEDQGQPPLVINRWTIWSRQIRRPRLCAPEQGPPAQGESEVSEPRRGF